MPDDDLFPADLSDQPAGMLCPACGEPAFGPVRVENGSAGQVPDHVLCRNIGCAVLMWEPGRTVAEQVADMHVIRMPRWLLDLMMDDDQ